MTIKHFLVAGLALLLIGCPDDDDDSAVTNDDDAMDDDDAVDDDDAIDDDDDVPTVPAAPTELAGEAISATEVMLSWTDNADNETSFRIERSIRDFDEWAEVGTVGADATSYTDATAIGGPVDYRVFATNDVDDSDPSNVAPVDMEYAPQVGVITVDTTTGDVTVVTQPPNMTLGTNGQAVLDTALVYNIPLTIENGFHRVMYALKGVVTDVQNGAPWNNTGEFAGSPYFSHGLHGLDIRATRDITLTAEHLAAGGDVITMTIEFMNHPLLFGTDDYYEGTFRAFDSSGTGDRVDIDLDGLNWNGDVNTPLRGVVTADGRTAWWGNRNQPAVLTLDLLNLTMSIGDTLIDGGNPITHDETGDLGFVRAVTLSPDGAFLYASLVVGAHNYENAINKTAGGTGTLEVVKIDTATMGIVGRIVLVDEVDEATLKAVSLSEDGSRAAVAVRVYGSSYGAPVADVHGKIYVFDTANMTLVPGPAADGFDVSAVGVRVDAAEITPNGERVFFVAHEAGTDPDTLQVLTLADGAVAEVAGSPSIDEKTTDLKFGPDDRLYWVTDDEALHIYDPPNQAWATPTIDINDKISFDPRSVEFTAEAYWVVDHDNERAVRFGFDDDTSVIASALGDSPWIDLTNVDEGHAELVTPF